MAIEPRDILPHGRMVEITRIDGEPPGPRPRTVPPGLRAGMLARVLTSEQIGTNGSAVLLYGLRIGNVPERQGDPEPLYAQLYAGDVHPLPVLETTPGASALEDARRRYANSEERSISEKELKEIRSKPLTSLVTPDMIAKNKANAERLKAEAEAERQKAIAKCRAEAEAAALAAQPRFADGTQNGHVPADIQKALAETGLK